MASPSDVTSTPRVLILGHSFVRRMEEFIRKTAGEGNFALNFELAQQCNVSMLGIGGRTVDKMVRCDLHKIRNFAPDIVVLELGSNDLCDETTNEETVALSIEAFVDMLHTEVNVKFIMMCHIITPANPPFEEYNDRVGNLNNELAKKALANTPFARMWRHRGLSNPSINIYLPDGIHLNDDGNKALYRSYRGAILLALKQI